jgi:hypothetical protein
LRCLLSLLLSLLLLLLLCCTGVHVLSAPTSCGPRGTVCYHAVAH